MANNKETGNFSLKWLPRCRWNVLDLINIFGRPSIPTYMTCDIDMSWAEDARKRLKEQGIKTTVTAILLKAIGIAQKDHPDSRSVRLPWGQVVTLNDIVAGFTVEKIIGSEPAVFLGLIKDPHKKSIEEIAAELREYGEKEVSEVPQLDIEDRFSRMPWLVRRFILRVGEIWPSLRLKYLSATFGVSSLGKFGVRLLIPPCVTTSTFGVGTVEKRPVVRDGEIQVRPMMTLALNFDHRLIDGAPAARFLARVRSLMEGGLSAYLDGTGQETSQSLPGSAAVSA